NAEDVLASPVSDVPSQTALRSAFPTPSNPETWFPFQLSESSEVRIEIHNASGQLVKTLHLGYKEAGYYLNREKAAFWDGKNDRGERVASGIYFYTMQTRNFTATGKVVILK
ncbi:T9SS type A sorting domain-containing protein, partial [bacterium]|nr:T9SS type A sorting domain-containing protein [bacterium]